MYDLFEKLRELAQGGDAAAKQIVGAMDAAHAAGENSKLQTLENTILDKCTNDFGFFHPLEAEYLKRLFNDRNRAAHPNHTKHNEFFTVSAEQARLHFRNAIELVLSQPATAGKAALDELFALIKTAYFPIEKDKVRLVLAASPLAKPKQNLFDTFISGVTSAALSGKLASADVRRRIVIVSAAFEMHHAFATELVNGSLRKVLGKAADDCLKWLLLLGCEAPQVRDAVDDSLNIKIEEFIKKGYEQDVALPAVKCLRANYFKELFEERIKSFKMDGIKYVIQFGEKPVPTSVVNRTIDLLSTAESWQDASDACAILNVISTDLTERQMQRIFKIADDNTQVPPAWEFRPLIEQLREHPLLKGAKFDEEMAKHSWGRRVKN